ncbi:uncharacterized protein KY384_001780 [Bacidia gigantensis]|uniref:uncharacterized protein n=1 Tax=Bacidia gigantensis TaxID=2732470 RepID=UPI001D03F6C3|nr:uncharacterized protein KY384_001780 [Bacidia gigantensis]KAG8532998.1 hypothetical protein KY384_001780 [Bacidia gigantensis]
MKLNTPFRILPFILLTQAARHPRDVASLSPSIAFPAKNASNGLQDCPLGSTAWPQELPCNIPLNFETTTLHLISWSGQVYPTTASQTRQLAKILNNKFYSVGLLPPNDFISGCSIQYGPISDGGLVNLTTGANHTVLEPPYNLTAPDAPGPIKTSAEEHADGSDLRAVDEHVALNTVESLVLRWGARSEAAFEIYRANEWVSGLNFKTGLSGVADAGG